ncbi:phosphoribosylformylglycinamidine synthase subunit PurS [Aerococcus sp. 1KP-2016]|uniref:phosphoribosylformylglycinamidine synthase subunit PurS n=1 Tax=Aerococcus sp. 1KP-2016 TaxID=1981982 RepID=UPI000B97E60E|nr:phosphoribosylformylglycinamidine synthase subunit PurS [Aerococcus sp. 1KP-2016]OYQ66658.1 hypothetical protein B9P78_05735 [Aerococcus sp. 1KP-2016]
MYNVKVYVTYKESILDPQGEAVRGAVHRMGFDESVRSENAEAVKEVFGQDAVEIGEVKDTRIAEIRTQTEELTIDVKELKDLWEGAIPWLLKSKA